MKTKVATALSIVGVLAAGSAAALVNTQILDAGPTESGASAAVLPEAAAIDLIVPQTTIDTIPVSTVVVTTQPPTTLAAVETSTTAAGPSGFLTAYNVGDAGVVTVDVVDGRLVLVSAEPKQGWTVTKAEDDSNDDSDELENEVEVEFASATVRVEFDAALVDGRIVPKVESYAIGGATAAAPGGATASPDTTIGHVGDDEHDDRDDGYEYEDDDHDDDHEDDRDDDDHDDDHDDEDDRDDDDHEDDRDDD